MANGENPVRNGQNSSSRAITARELYLGPAVVFAVFVATAIVTYLNTRTLFRDAELVTHTHEALAALGDVLSLMQDAETGQRGCILSENEAYLEPYSTAVARLPERLDRVQQPAMPAMPLAALEVCPTALQLDLEQIGADLADVASSA